MHMPMSALAAEYEPPAPPPPHPHTHICLRGALEGCLGVCDSGGFAFCWLVFVGRFDEKLAVQQLFPSLSS
jgi:hypothetical protein